MVPGHPISWGPRSCSPCWRPRAGFPRWWCSAPATRAVSRSATRAAALVSAGVPMVVGMSGEVADSACRLFTRRFYEALLQGESVAAATAEGRRAGLTGADPYHTVDWAFPSLLLSECA